MMDCGFVPAVSSALELLEPTKLRPRSYWQLRLRKGDVESASASSKPSRRTWATSSTSLAVSAAAVVCGASVAARHRRSHGAGRQASFKKALQEKPAWKRQIEGQWSPMVLPRVELNDVFSLDVECVAVGKTHRQMDRAPCSMALVNGHGQVVMQTLIRPGKPVVSYLTPFTGLEAGDLDEGKAVSLEVAVAQLKRILPRTAILVGQNPEGDAEWMQLKKGEDYANTLDLGEVFSNRQGFLFSLRHEAFVLLGKSPDSGIHNPAWDASVSIELYQKAREATLREMALMIDKLTRKDYWPPKPSLAKLCGYQIDGVCLSMFAADCCSCGMPVLPHIPRKRVWGIPL